MDIYIYIPAGGKHSAPLTSFDLVEAFPRVLDKADGSFDEAITLDFVLSRRDAMGTRAGRIGRRARIPSKQRSTDASTYPVETDDDFASFFSRL